LEEIEETAIHNLQRVATAHSRQWLYLLGEDGVVYSETRNLFAGLDAAGVSAYRAFDGGASVQDLMKLDSTSSSSNAQEDALNAIYALSQGRFFTGGLANNLENEDPRTAWPPLDRPANANLVLHDIPVFLEYSMGAPGELCRDCFESCPATTQAARCRMSAHYAEDGWAIHVNDRPLLSALRAEQIGLGFLHAARSLLYAESGYDIAFHAAMVTDRDRGVMLCAPREAGKSTLAAYLAAHGYEFLADEPALLRLDTASVTSLRLPISLKEGSWAVLQREWPQAAHAPIHLRSDGVRIRLLHAPQTRLSARLTHIVFPCYDPASTPAIEQLTPLRTLSLLNDGGMLLGRDFARPAFEAFLRLICAVPAYAMRYASLDEAARMIQALP
jgi:hypothetical protein